MQRVISLDSACATVLTYHRVGLHTIVWTYLGVGLNTIELWSVKQFVLLQCQPTIELSCITRYHSVGLLP